LVLARLLLPLSELLRLGARTNQHVRRGAAGDRELADAAPRFVGVPLRVEGGRPAGLAHRSKQLSHAHTHLRHVVVASDVDVAAPRTHLPRAVDVRVRQARDRDRPPMRREGSIARPGQHDTHARRRARRRRERHDGDARVRRRAAQLGAGVVVPEGAAQLDPPPRARQVARRVQAAAARQELDGTRHELVRVPARESGQIAALHVEEGVAEDEELGHGERDGALFGHALLGTESKLEMHSRTACSVCSAAVNIER